MTAITQQQPEPTTRSETVALVGGSSGLGTIARQITATLLSVREKAIGTRAPRSEYVKNLRADLRRGGAQPVKMLLAVAFADLDDNAPAQLVTQPHREIIERIEQYAARRERRAGILSFTDALRRKLVFGLREECEARVATTGGLETVEALDEAITQLAQEIAADQETLALMTAEKVRRQASR